MTTKALRFRYIHHYTQICFKILTSSKLKMKKKKEIKRILIILRYQSKNIKTKCLIVITIENVIV